MGTPPLVLVIEDSPTQAQQLDVILAARGLQVIIADDGLKGLRMVDERHPDLIVLDVNLPTMDGLQVCKRLKRDPNTAHIPIVMLTAADSASATVQGLNVGADDYIPKDSSATENLLATLDVYLNNPLNNSQNGS